MLAFLLDAQFGGLRGGSSLFHSDTEVANKTLLKYCTGVTREVPFLTYSLPKLKVVYERITLVQQYFSIRLYSPVPLSILPNGIWAVGLPREKGKSYDASQTSYFVVSHCLNAGHNISERLFHYLAVLIILLSSPQLLY